MSKKYSPNDMRSMSLNSNSSHYKAAMDNHSNQLNPNNSAYSSSRDIFDEYDYIEDEITGIQYNDYDEYVQEVVVPRIEKFKEKKIHELSESQWITLVDYQSTDVIKEMYERDLDKFRATRTQEEYLELSMKLRYIVGYDLLYALIELDVLSYAKKLFAELQLGSLDVWSNNLNLSPRKNLYDLVYNDEEWIRFLVSLDVSPSSKELFAVYKKLFR